MQRVQAGRRGTNHWSFKIQPKVGGISETELTMQSKFLRPAIIGKTNSAAKHEHEAELYDITVEEASEKV